MYKQTDVSNIENKRRKKNFPYFIFFFYERTQPGKKKARRREGTCCTYPLIYTSISFEDPRNFNSPDDADGIGVLVHINHPSNLMKDTTAAYLLYLSLSLSRAGYR